MAPEDDWQLRREFLTSGISDTEGTIHANDTKCSAALVTHGLVFAGLVTVSANAAGLYPQANNALRIIALCLAGFALAAFLVSIICLLRAVMPYRPRRLIALIRDRDPAPPGVFFPELYGGEDPVQDQVKAVEALTEETVVYDLVCESVKLAGIRIHEGRWARRGYRALIVELLLAGGYLAIVAVTALGTL